MKLLRVEHDTGLILSTLTIEQDELEIPEGYVKSPSNYEHGFHTHFRNGKLINNYSFEQVKTKLIVDVQTILDKTAQSHGYDNIASLVSYNGDANPIFNAEGKAGIKWRSTCWEKCFQIIDDIKAGLRTYPTDSGLISELPPMIWPVTK